MTKHLTPSDITPAPFFFHRRKFLQAAIAAPFAVATGVAPAFAQDLTPTAQEDFLSYTNYYEFGTGKDSATRYAQGLTTAPWSITVDGLVENPGTYALEDLIKDVPVVDRLYRFRCVEAWAMVVPWQGVMLKDVLAKIKPQTNARYVVFQTLYRPEEMPGQKTGSLNWPYQEGLRLDEANQDLTLLATGAYGQPLAPQNGAPLRLVVPWKYGFKSIKAITRISLTETQPDTTWAQLAPSEYGFYANVNLPGLKSEASGSPSAFRPV